jgi:hypothetical protein
VQVDSRLAMWLLTFEMVEVASYVAVEASASVELRVHSSPKAIHVPAVNPRGLTQHGQRHGKPARQQTSASEHRQD